MARIDWIETRLQNWARWQLTRGGAGGLGYASVQLTGANAGRDGYVSSAVPINDVEASETDDAVHCLPGELRVTVIECYVAAGHQAEKLARLCCSKRTMHARVERAHRLLADHFTARKDRASAERERVEALQRGR